MKIKSTRIDISSPPIQGKGKNVYMLKDVAAYFDVTTATVRNWIKKGILQVLYTPGGHRRIRKGEFEKFVKEYSLK